jgi:threonine dehydrogenase-like Zn-dependent dehydrogenase
VRPAFPAVHNLLLQLDSSSRPSVFDRVVAFDGGADHVMSYGSVTPDAVRELVHGALFTRGPQDLRHTAIFIGGQDMAAGEHLLAAVRDTFFGPFRVSVMLDANGANTTAVAAVARIEGLGEVKGRKAVVVAGSGPVGSRVAGLLAAAGATVAVTSRRDSDGALPARIGRRFNVTVTERVLRTSDDAADVLGDAEIVVNTGPAGVCLVPRSAWAERRSLKILVDLNAVPPAGVEGVEPADKATTREGVVTFGALGVGSLKMKLHKACIRKLFERNDVVLDAESIASIARDLTSRQ